MFATRGKLTFLLGVCYIIVALAGDALHTPEIVHLPNILRVAIWFIPGLLALPLVHLPCGSLVSLGLMTVGPAERFMSFFVLWANSGFEQIQLSGALNFALLIALTAIARLPTTKECEWFFSAREGV